MFSLVSKFELNKSLFIHLAVFVFPVLIVTVSHGGAVPYLLLLIFGFFLGWPAWRSLESWERNLLVGFIIFFVLISLSLINTEYLREGVKSVEKIIHFPLLVPMYLLLKRLNVDAGKTYLYAIGLATLVIFMQAYYQRIELGLPRSAGAYNPIVMGDIAILFAMIIAGALTTLAIHKHHYFLGVIAIGLAVVASILSGSRGSWIVVPVIVLWLAWLQRKNIGLKYFVTVSIVFLLLFLGVTQIDKIKHRSNQAVDNYQRYTEDDKDKGKLTSVGMRFELWKDAVEIWKENPIFGTGIGDYRPNRIQLYEKGELIAGKKHGHAHSIYFDVLATAGIVGFIAMLVFVLILPFRMFYSFWDKECDTWVRFYALSGMITIIAFAVFGLTEAWLGRNPFVRTYLMCVLVFMSSISVRKARLSSLVDGCSSSADCR